MPDDLRDTGPSIAAYVLSNGHEGIRRFMAKASALHKDLRVEPEVFIEAGEAVIVIVDLTGRGTTGPLDAQRPSLASAQRQRTSIREYPDLSRVLPSIGQAAADRPVVYPTSDRFPA